MLVFQGIQLASLASELYYGASRTEDVAALCQHHQDPAASHNTDLAVFAVKWNAKIQDIRVAEFY